MSHATKAIIFDFDGTLADSFNVSLEAMSAIIKRPQVLPPEEIEALRNLGTRDIIRRLGIKPWQVPRLLLRGRQEITKRMDEVKPFDGIPEAVKLLAADYHIYILSTNTEANIVRFLTKARLENDIRRIYGGIGLMGKASNLKKVINREPFDRPDCLYVGDETRDIEAAKKIGIKCVAVKWGYNHARILETRQPNALADTPRHLPPIIAQLLG